MNVPDVLPVAAVLGCHRGALEGARRALRAPFGEPLLAGPVFPFTFTDYYAPQTGADALKQFLAFPPAPGPPDLAAWKQWAVQAEKDLVSLGSPGLPRPVNLDPGLLCLGNLTLASTKEAGHRVYLRDGIWAEVELLWRDGAFTPLPWTYPDYRTSGALAFFSEAREALRAQRKGRASRGEGRPPF